jgi:hypothetical protein
MATKTSWVTAPLSPYRLADIMSSAVGRDIAPQAIYGATRQKDGVTPRLATTLGETGHQVVSPEDANAFIQAYLDRQEAKAKAAEDEELAETS